MTINLFTTENVEGRIDVGRAVGSDATVMFIYDLAPGQASCPYHYEYEEEWLLVVEGAIVLRTPEGELELAKGDIHRFAPGPAGAHKIMNRGDLPARTLAWSSNRVPAVSVYPDSDKIAVWAGDDNDLIFRRETAVAWEHGEDGWSSAD
jgi:uncharacterized cupin superfamily protein